MRGLAVVDLDLGAKIGQVHELVLDPRGRRIAGVVVARGGSLLGGGGRQTIPASAMQAIGDDAVTVWSSRVSDDALEPLADKPVLSQVIGRKVLTHGGQLLGSIGDVLLHPKGCRIAGYLMAPTAGSGLGGLFGGRAAGNPCLRPDAELHVGRDIVVVAEGAFVDSTELEADADLVVDEPPPMEARVVRPAPPIDESAPLVPGLEATARMAAIPRSPERALLD